ncbi:MAG: thermonuclease family protein [Pseudobdellovibrionaceae bacterium]
MRFITFILVAAFLQIVTASSFAKEGDRGPSPTIFRIKLSGLVPDPVPVTIKSVADPLTLIDEQGTVYSLTGLDVPGLIKGDPAPARAAQERLAQLTLGQSCIAHKTRSEDMGRVNRLGQYVIHLTCGPQHVWIQGELLAEGLARVRTVPGNVESAAALLELEKQARTEKLGLWKDPAYAVRSATSLIKESDDFFVVEGVVATASQKSNMIYLNFGHDWHSDFSVGIPASLRQDFSREHVNLLSLARSRVRVRGWMRDYNGPFIELDNSAQLELLDEKPRGFDNAPSSGMQSIKTPEAPQIDKPKALEPRPSSSPETKKETSEEKILRSLFNQ